MTKIVNGLLLLGAEVIYEGMYDVHVSGHACQEEQKLMLTLTRPKYFLPVHGEYKQLKKHAITAASLGIPTSNILIAENGSNIILSQDEMKLGEPVTAGAVMVDGLGVGDVGNVVLRDRKHLSEQDRQSSGRPRPREPRLRLCAGEREPDGRRPEHRGDGS